jgi:hypothetical protein
MVLLYQSAYRGSQSHFHGPGLESTKAKPRASSHRNAHQASRPLGHVLLCAIHRMSTASFSVGRLNVRLEQWPNNCLVRSLWRSDASLFRRSNSDSRYGDNPQPSDHPQEYLLRSSLHLLCGKFYDNDTLLCSNLV